MTEDIKPQQTAQDTTNEAETCREGNAVEIWGEAETARPNFNRYLYENFRSNVECQLEYWNGKADREVDPQVAQALRLKAEGLGYALRLLNAFEPEFRELVECASHAATN